MPSPLDAIIAVGRRLAKLETSYAFLGGSIIPLLVDNPDLYEARPTKDVDVIVEIVTNSQLSDLESKLRDHGFRNIQAGAPICRWEVDGFQVDIMPIEERVLGLSSKWFRIALAQAKQISLEAITVPVITRTCFLATKLEAFKDRGNEDFYLSHDFEDIVALIDGAQNIVGDVANSELSLRRYVADGLAGLMKNSNFFDALPGHFPADSGGARRQRIIERMREISRL